MSTLQVVLLDRTVTFHIEELECTVPVGPHALADDITSDPPSPEELINAIGWVQDHLEDVTRELPMAEFADRVEASGVGVATLADVEVGGEAPLPFELAREAAAAPTVRKIQGPAAEPIELSDVAGSALLKRLLPAFGGLVLLLLVLRRLRK